MSQPQWGGPLRPAWKPAKPYKSLARIAVEQVLLANPEYIADPPKHTVKGRKAAEKRQQAFAMMIKSAMLDEMRFALEEAFVEIERLRAENDELRRIV